MRPSLSIFVIGALFAITASITYSLPGIGKQVKGLLKGVAVKLPIIGTATWYGQRSMGSCGWWSKDSDYIVALSNQ